MLTEKQRDLLLFIHDRLAAGGLVPSFDEMREALGLKSKSGIHRLISALEERGYIERLPNRARALEIKKLPEALKSPDEKHGSQMIPLYGKIAAGTPIEAIQHEGNYTDIPANMVGNGEHYALTVEGDSMMNAGINDGDTVVIRKCDAANTNDIVVALVDGHEATLKRFRTFQGKVALVPENDAYKTRLLDPSRVQIQGQLVSLLRAY